MSSYIVQIGQYTFALISALAQGTDLVEVHTDKRRTIWEKNGDRYSLQRFLFHESIAAGNHCHTKKNEYFVVLEGAGTLYTRDVVENEEVRGRISAGETIDPSMLVPGMSKAQVKEGDGIRIPAWTVHTFVFVPGSRMVCYSDKPFDPGDMDMPAFKLVD